MVEKASASNKKRIIRNAKRFDHSITAIFGASVYDIPMRTDKIHQSKTEEEKNGPKYEHKRCFKDLPNVYRDIDHFEKFTQNFQTKNIDTKFKELNPDHKKVDETMTKIKELVAANSEKGEDTFVGIYFAGHGGMADNQQAFVLNDVNELPGKAKIGYPKFVYPVEKMFRRNLAPYGKRCFGMMVFDCCSADLTKYKIKPETKDQKSQPQSTNLTRGDGEDTCGLNYVTANAANSNGVVADDNDFMPIMMSEFRLNCKEGEVLIPQAFADLSKRFPGCVVKSNVLFDAIVPYQDKEFQRSSFDSDLHDPIIPQMETLDLKEPKDFCETDNLELVKAEKLPDGSVYTGTMLNDLPFGFGRNTFPPEFKGHPDFSWKKMPFFVFYQGNCKYGMLDGPGTLLCEEDEIYIGQFKSNQLHAQGKTIIFNDAGDKSATVGQFKHGMPHGEAVRKFATGDIQSGQFIEGQSVGVSLSVWPHGISYFGQKKGHKRNGLGVGKQADGSEYCGQFKDGDNHGFGMYTYADKSTYKGQWLNSDLNGYGKFTYPDGSYTENFSLDGLYHGISIDTDKDGKVTYCLNNKDIQIAVLTDEEVDAVNNGHVYDQMKVFSDPKFNLDPQEQLDFNFLKRQRHNMLMVVDDVVTLARRANMFDHQPDQKAVKECDDLLEQHEDLVNKLKTMMHNQTKEKNVQQN